MTAGPLAKPEFEISVDGTPRTIRDVKEVAIEAARLLAQSARKVTITDLRGGSLVDWDK
jgi:hypothetical protein